MITQQPSYPNITQPMSENKTFRIENPDTGELGQVHHMPDDKYQITCKGHKTVAVNKQRGVRRWMDRNGFIPSTPEKLDIQKRNR